MQKIKNTNTTLSVVRKINGVIGEQLKTLFEG